MHLLVWLVLFYMPIALTAGSNTGWKDVPLHFWLQLIFLAVIFYTNYFLLVDKWLLSRRQMVIYVLLNLALIALLIFLKGQILSLEVRTPRPEARPGPPKRLVWYIDFLMYLVPVAFAIAIRSGQKLINMQVYRSEAENMKLQAELQSLKYQLQPHFFFNALNNIYALIETEPAKAQQSVHSLGKLMRHLLAASEAHSITLQDEIEFLKKYIELMEQRLSSKTTVSVHFPEHVPAIQIAPLLFISLVENAFKHGVSATQYADISFNMEADAHKVSFTSINTCMPKTADDLSGSGIGLANLEKRLSLLYPDQHKLVIKNEDGNFIVNLEISI